MTTTAVKQTEAGKLSYRLATDGDLPILRDFRRECGWGLDRLNQVWGQRDYSYCVFSLEKDGVKEDVGMGGWRLDDPEDQVHSSRELGNVELVSLFIRKAYQDLGLGTQALAILEQGAVDVHHAQWITLDTAAHFCEPTPDGFYIERVDVPNRAIKWYESKGYKVYRPNEPLFPNPGPDGVDGPLITATFLRKRPPTVSQ